MRSGPGGFTSGSIAVIPGVQIKIVVGGPGTVGSAFGSGGM